MSQQLLRPVQQQCLSARRTTHLAKVTPGVQRSLTWHTQLACGSSRQAACDLSRASRLVARSTPDESPAKSQAPAAPDSVAGNEQDGSQLLFSIGIAALWIGLLAYAFLLAPNQTPYRDQIFLERILGLGEKDGFVVNPVFVSLFNLMGVYPAIYACLLVPGGRSQNKVPAWPFVALSFGFGAFALLPYMALWRPYSRPEDNPLPPPASELEGWSRLFMRGAEGPVMPALLLAGAAACLYQAASSGGGAWQDMLSLFDESRLVHVTSLDFAILTALAPFWMELDAAGRRWDKRSQLLPVLSLLPVLGPCIYLLLRPKTQQQQPQP